MSGQVIEVVSVLTRSIEKAGSQNVKRVQQRSEEFCATRQFWSGKGIGGDSEITMKAGNIRDSLTP